MLENNVLNIHKSIVPVAFISDADFMMQTGVAITSLIENKNLDTEYDIFVLVSDCKEEKIQRLMSLSREDAKITCIKCSTEKYSDIEQTSHIPIACLLKFDLCELIPQYDKIVYVDGDVYIRGDLRELFSFNMGESHIAGVKSLEMISADKQLINAGVLLFNAKKMREDRMSSRLIDERRKIGISGSMDQKVMNMVFENELSYIPYAYNCLANHILDSPHYYTIDKLNALYETNYKSVKQFLDEAIIIHFASGSKPWKYSYLYGGDEWYSCYKNSIYGSDGKIRRKNKFQVRMMAFISAVKGQGIRGFFERVLHYMNHIVGKNDSKFWG